MERFLRVVPEEYYLFSSDR